MAARIPDPAASIALHLLRNVRVLAGGLGGILSDVAHKAFPEDEERPAQGLRPMPDGPLRRQARDASLMCMIADRIGVDAHSPRLSAARQTLDVLDEATGQPCLSAEEAATYFIRLTAGSEDPQLRLSVFATLLLLVHEPSGMVPREVMAKRSADLSRVLKDEILSSRALGDERGIARILKKYAAHV